MKTKRYRLIVLKNEKDVERVDSLIKIAANHNLLCLHKIGIYGEEQQHELFINGNLWDYLAFKKELKNPVTE